MIMRQIKFSVLVTLIVVLFASCSKNDYLNVIPKDATFVASVNFANIAEKGELSESAYIESLKQYMGIMLNEDAQKQVEEYISDPREMGIDFTAPVYMFLTPSKCACITMKVGSKDKVEDLVTLLKEQGLCSKPVEREGFMTGTLLEDIEYAYDSNTLLVLASLNDGSSAIGKQVVAQLFDQEKDDSFVSTERFDIMDDNDDKDVVMYCNLASVPNDMSMAFKSSLPDGVRLSDVDIVSTMSFLDGKAVMDINVNGLTDKAKKAFEDTDKHMRKIQGQYVDAPAEDFFVWACFGVDGEWFLKNLKKNDSAKQLLLLVERAIDIEQIIRSVDGDMAFVLPSTFITGESGSGVIDFIATAQVKDTKFLADVDYWKRTMRDYGLSMSEGGKNQYVINGNDMSMCWGVDDNNVYMASTEAFNSNLTSRRSTLLNGYKSDILHSRFYMYVNLQSLPLAELATMSGAPGYAGVLQSFKAFTIKSESSNKVQLTLELKDKKKNFVKAIFNS